MTSGFQASAGVSCAPPSKSVYFPPRQGWMEDDPPPWRKRWWSCCRVRLPSGRLPLDPPHCPEPVQKEAHSRTSGGDFGMCCHLIIVTSVPWAAWVVWTVFSFNDTVVVTQNYCCDTVVLDWVKIEKRRQMLLVTCSEMCVYLRAILCQQRVLFDIKSGGTDSAEVGLSSSTTFKLTYPNVVIHLMLQPAYQN